ncbi:MAG: serine hydrolase domain-containing protein [Armatimonadota bacterium]
MSISQTLSQIDDLILRRMKEQRVPGASVSIIHDDKPLLLKGYGFADIERQIPVTESTTFQIASLTKQFTAMLVTMLAYEGKLHLDDSITKWFPEGIDKWSMISVRHLIAHLSGISDKPMNDLDDQRDYTEDEFVQSIASAPLLWQPGTKWDYCNSGYVLLGVIIHRVTGKPWYEAMSERIFEPLRMTSARVIDENPNPDRAIGYEITDGTIHPQGWIAPSHNTTADGGLLMSAQDFVAWSKALSSDQLLPQSEIQRMWGPVRFRDGRLAGTPALRFGLGWMLPHEPNFPRMVQHKGAWQGFSTYIARLLDTKTTVVVLTNMEDEPSNPAQIGHDILSLLVQI